MNRSSTLAETKHSRVGLRPKQSSLCRAGDSRPRPDPSAKPQQRTCPPFPSVDFQSYQRPREPWGKSPGDSHVPGHPSLFSAFGEQASPSKSLMGFLMLPLTYSHSPRNGQISGKLPTSTTNQNKQKNRNPEETETMP